MLILKIHANSTTYVPAAKETFLDEIPFVLVAATGVLVLPPIRASNLCAPDGVKSGGGTVGTGGGTGLSLPIGGVFPLFLRVAAL